MVFLFKNSTFKVNLYFCFFTLFMNSKKIYTIEEATRKLEAYCAYQDCCHKEVISKLQSMQMIPLAIDTIVTYLIQNNFLNEERYAKSFARGKFNIKRWGRRRIVQELKQRDISKFNIETALKEIPEDEYLLTLHELAEKKLQLISDHNILKKKKKLADYLLYRGWETHLVYEKINELI